MDNAFSNAFIYAYQLGDLITGLEVASIYVGALIEKGYVLKKAFLSTGRRSPSERTIGALNLCTAQT